MKALIILLLVLMLIIPASCVAEQTDAAPRVLVAYFSCTGNTEGVARSIADELGADMYRITPEIPYTQADLDYRDAVSRANREQNDKNARPAIGGEPVPIEDYDVLFVGYPIWWGGLPRILYTFFESHDFAGKVVIPFCTSGSSGIGATEEDIRALLPNADVRDGLSVTSRQLGDADALAREWLEGMSFPKASVALTVQIGDKAFTVALEDSASVQALIALLPLDLHMTELNGNEKYAYLPIALPTDARAVGRINAGDLMLYGKDCLVLFYKDFDTSYRYTPLGHMSDAEGLAEALGRGEARVTITRANGAK